MRQFSYTNPFLASNIKEEKTKLKSGDEPSLFPKGSRKKGGVKVRPLRKKNFFLLFFCILLLSSNGHLAWGGRPSFLNGPAIKKRTFFATSLSFKWNGSLYIYPQSTHSLTHSLTGSSVRIMLSHLKLVPLVLGPTIHTWDCILCIWGIVFKDLIIMSPPSLLWIIPENFVLVQTSFLFRKVTFFNSASSFFPGSSLVKGDFKNSWKQICL